MSRLSLFLVAAATVALSAEPVLAKGHASGHDGSHHAAAHHNPAHHAKSPAKTSHQAKTDKQGAQTSPHQKSNGQKANASAPSAETPQDPEDSASTTNAAGATNPGIAIVGAEVRGGGLAGSRGYHRGYGNSYRHRSHRRVYVQGRPSFVKGPDQTVAVNSGPSVVNPWATIVSARSDGLGGGGMRFQVTGDSNPALFSQPPTVSSTGMLSFTPAAGQSGMATLTLVLLSSGGSSNPQTFHITVKPA